MGGTRQRRFVTKPEKSFLSPPEGEAWVWMSRAMLESPAWRALSRAGLQFVSRLCVENMAHAGKENGRLALGYDDIERAGIHRGMIFQTIAEVMELGFVRCTREGRFAWGADPGRRATYRLTFCGVVGDDAGPPTDDWKTIGTDEHAKQAVAKAKAAEPKKVRRRIPTRDIEYGAQNRTGHLVRKTALGNGVA